MASIIERAPARGIVLSYNEEGILTRDEIEQMLERWSLSGGDGDLKPKTGSILHEIPYRRFRSDSDGLNSRTGSSRNFRPAEGRNEDEVHEWLFAIEKLQGERC
jgi:hypothetical protein